MKEDTAPRKFHTVDARSNGSPRRLHDLLPTGINAALVLETIATECQIRVQDVEDVYPCTPSQAALMVATSNSPKAYICNYRYEVPKAVDIERLRDAWERVKRTEPILRNRIVWNDESHSFLQATIAYECCSTSPSGFEDSMTFGRDLSKVKIARVEGSHQYMFQIRIHHSIVDGQSLALILRKVQKAYESHQSLSPGPTFKQFISHVCHMNQQHQKSQGQAFWDRYLDGASVLDFPMLPPDPDHTATTNGSQSVQISLDLDKLVKRCGVSPATILYAATAIVLGAHAGTADVSFGLTLSGRDAPIDGVDSMIGPTIATVPFRTQFESQMSVEQYLRNVQSRALDLTPHQQYGLQEIKKLSPGARAACGFRSHVIVQPYDQTAGDNRLLEKLDYGAAGVLDDFPLSIEFMLGRGQISINCSFDSAYISHSDINVVISHLRCTLADVSTLPLSSELCQLRLADDTELSQIHEWAQYRCPSTLPVPMRQLRAVNGNVAFAGNDKGIEHQWIIIQDTGGKIRPAPILCPGKLAFSTFDPSHRDQQDNGVEETHFIDEPGLHNGSRFARIRITDLIGYCGADGQIHALRSDDRIKTIKGRSVKPWDSERRLRSLGGKFTDCVVDGVVNNADASKLAAFINLGFDGDKRQSDLLIAKDAFDSSFKEMCLEAQRKVLNVLSEPDIPTYFIPVSYIPANRQALTDAFIEALNSGLFVDREEAGDGVIGRLPETTMELDIEAIFQEVFQIESRLTTMDQFFQLGGDSFTAVSLIAAAKRRNYTLSVSQIYQNPRLGDLANVAMLCPQTTSDDDVYTSSPAPDRFDFLRAEAAQLCKVPEHEIEDLYHASPFQASLAAASSRKISDNDRDFYFARIAFELSESVDLSRLSRALEVFISRNPIFRTRIVQSSEGTMQVVIRRKPLQLAPELETVSVSDELHHASFGEGRPLFHYRTLHAGVHEKPRLILSIHHLLYDGWSLDKFLIDVTYNYSHPQAERSGRRPYSSFIQHLAMTDKNEAADYWMNALANMTVANFPQVPPSAYKPEARDHLVSAKYLDPSQIRRGGVTVATVVVASWALLLSSYCNTSDVCFATVLSGRDDGFFEDIMGPTIATIPMRVVIEASDDVSRFLATIQLSLLNMQKYQHYGLDNISRLPADGPRNVTRLASILVMQQNMKRPTAEDEQGDLLSAINEETQMLTDFPLVLQSGFDAKTSQLELDLRYDNLCIDTQEAERVLCQLHHVVGQLSTLAGSISQVESATREDKAAICAWNRGPLSKSPSSLHRMFEEMASQAPQSPAVDSMYGPKNLYRKLSYGQLDAYANDLAFHIAETCSSQNPLVAVCFSKSPLMIISMIAVLKTGRAFVPMDTSSPTKRIQTMLDSLGGDALVMTDISNINRFENMELIAFDEEKPDIVYRDRLGISTLLRLQDQISMGQLPSYCRALPASTAYVLHTSGSTGKPKGIVVSHSTATTALLSIGAKFKVNKSTRILQLASLAFDASVLEMFITLISGGCICMLSNDSRLAGDIARAAKALSVNFVLTTPTLASFWDPKDFTSLRTLVLVGEPIPSHLLYRWMDRPTRPWIINGYGPAEAGFISCANTSVSAKDPSNIGYPVGCCVFIADLSDHYRLAAIGAVGELIICGHNVSDGYLSNSEASAFGENWPGCLSQGEGGGRGLRYYRSGDLARYCSNGSIQLLGRKDTQRKIHGQRIELGEIESSILMRTQFHGVVVDLLGSSTLVAFLELNTSITPFKDLLPANAVDLETLDGLIVSLKDILPTYMIPTVYVPVANFPTNSSGKTDRGLLRASVESFIDDYRIDKKRVKRQPKTENEATMRQLWADAINIQPETIGVDDGFFALGGSSVGVIRLLQSIRKRRMKLDVSAVYKVNTLSEMAAMLETTDNPPLPVSDGGPPSPFSLMEGLDRDQCIALASQKCNVQSSAVLDLYPCSYMQEALMMSSAKFSSSYFVQSTYRLPASTKFEKLTKTLQSVWEKHDILRTRIFLDDNFCSAQVVLDEALDVSILRKPLDVYLEQDMPPGYGDPLSRCAIVASGQDTYLVLSQHHAVFDAWSLGLLMQEIKKAYFDNPSESAMTHQYASYINSTLRLQSSLDAAKYWRDLLDQSNIARLPGVKKGTFRANREYKATIDMPPRQTHALATLLEATWSILLGRYTESEDVCFGVVQSGRAASVNGFDAIMGPTLVSIPRRLRPTRQSLVVDYLTHVREFMIEAQPWEQYSLGKIRSLSDSAHQACNFQSMVIVQHQTDLSQPSSTDDLELELLEQHGAWSDNCLTLECQPQQQGKLSVSLSYDDRLLPEEDVRWLSHHFCRLLLEIIAKPTHQIKDLDIVGPEGIQQAHVWNEYPIPISSQRIERLFHDRLVGWPTATAIDAIDARLTYRELDELSSRLACYLRDQGMARGDLVPLCVEKSAIMIVIILAVLKAGGAYVPMEIDLPFERMQYIIKDTNARVIICTPRQEILCKRLGCSLVMLDMDRLQQLTS
ncbi:MAG: hypothetical protein Q9222_005874 [Ikaeria aurantiellina]